MTAEIVPLEDRRYRSKVPKEHCTNLDTRLQWLWHQKFGTVQMVYTKSEDLLDKTAATLILQAIMAKDLKSIQQLYQRLEGGALFDDDSLDDEGGVRI